MNATKSKAFAQQLIDYIYDSPSQFHATATAKKQLLAAGFAPLLLEDKWEIRPGQKYFVERNQSTIIAFIVGTGPVAQHGFRFVAAHTDSPNFKIKTSPEINASGNYKKLNVEVYGGPIFHTWLDRPLSFAGRVSLRSQDPMQPVNRLVHFRKHLLTIPNLAIHLNREVNAGKAYNPQIDMMPILGQWANQQEGFYDLIAGELGVSKTDIIEFDLHLYETTKGTLAGLQEEFISTGRLDNLAMVHAGLASILEAQPQASTAILACFDNEEIGCQTKQGAASPLLRHITERIVEKLGGNNEDFQRAIYQSFMISADMAHAVHPNLPEKHDPIIRPEINRGPAIKLHASQKYTSDGDSVAVYEMICRRAGIPYQKFVNRSDMASGGTLGSISSAQLDVRSVDIGNPMLAMHSAREFAGTHDHLYIKLSFDEFFRV